MQGKEVFSKQINNYLKIFLIFLFIFLNKNVLASEDSLQLKKNINNYLRNINQLSANFLQSDNYEISEGEIFLKNKRVRINYLSPSKITIILSDKKAMYFNEELLELEYFNPKETLGGVFYNIFYGESFYKDTKISDKKGYITLKKKILLDGVDYKIKIYFEKKPLNIKKIETVSNETTFGISFSNLNYNPSFTKNYFSMASPILN